MRERVKMKEEGYSRSVPKERMTRGGVRSQEPETSNPKLKTLTAKLAVRGSEGRKRPSMGFGSECPQGSDLVALNHYR
jgi:hypothetical protein